MIATVITTPLCSIKVRYCASDGRFVVWHDDEGERKRFNRDYGCHYETSVSKAVAEYIQYRGWGDRPIDWTGTATKGFTEWVFAARYRN